MLSVHIYKDLKNKLYNTFAIYVNKGYEKESEMRGGVGEGLWL